MRNNNPSALPSGYAPWWVGVASHLGGVYPFQDKGFPTECSLDIAKVIDARRGRGESVCLDSVGLVTKAALPYLLGNRTLLQGVIRAPWMSVPCTNGDWLAAELPPHGTALPDPATFVCDLRSALLDEARAYVDGARTVGILLSGGMDSRVLAGVVRALQESSDGAFSVVGLTWGKASSRDVIYARRITERFGWDWQHYPITAETLSANFGHMAKMGAEVSPLHLHAMPAVAATDGLDVVLAGSYGDMVGRAEFSGRRVTRLKDVLPTRLDQFGVLRYEALMATESNLQVDVADSPHLDDKTSLVRRHEIEQHVHYTRRMLQSCMLFIASETRFYQIFTAPAVFGRMWGLDPSVRDDQWYSRLLPLLPGNLLDIPWARTGRLYDRPGVRLDEFDAKHHAYGSWLRGELRHEVLRRLNSDRIRGLGVFNELGLELALRAWGRAGTKTTNRLDELVTWLATLHDFLEIYEIEVPRPLAESTRKDRLRALRGGALALAYVEARERMRG